MSFSLGLIDWAICLVFFSSSILFGLYLAVRKKSSADSSFFFWSVGRQAGDRLFPLLHAGPLKLNYTYRGLWGTLAGVITLFALSSVPQKTDPAKLKRLKIHWKNRSERFRGIFDWRLQLRAPDGNNSVALLAALIGMTASPGFLRKDSDQEHGEER